MRPDPMYCEWCGQDGMCPDCERDYAEAVAKRRRQEWLFWTCWGAAAAFSVACLVWSMWPKK